MTGYKSKRAAAQDTVNYGASSNYPPQPAQQLTLQEQLAMAQAARDKALDTWDKACAARNKVDAAWDKADAAWDKTLDTWNKADADREKAWNALSKADAEIKRIKKLMEQNT